ncbi:MAG: preprotein translocase subunit SecY, partial [Patescibacteria group bacterium]
FIIAVFRLLAHVPVPGVDTSTLKAYLSGNAILGIFDLFSGGALQNFSIVTLGVGPYINASIIIQLFTIMIPKLEELSKEGEYGREKINMYTKFLTVPLALLQSYGIYFLLSKQGIIPTLGIFQLVILILTLMAGTMLLTWIGDLVTEYGVGNGISILIFVGIISRLPVTALQVANGLFTGSAAQIMGLVIFLLFSLLVVMSVVLVNEGTRNVLIEYGRRSERSQKVTNYLPMKINQAGVIPIIFAVSAVSLPSMISGPFVASSNTTLQNIGIFLNANFSQENLLYNVIYFVLVFGFTYFYTSIQFDPVKIADDIKKRGGFIPGIRPGSNTSAYLKGVISRITLSGALFLGLIAILPFLVTKATGFTDLSIGGSGLLIVVSVVLETVRQVESLMTVRDYQSFLH